MARQPMQMNQRPPMPDMTGANMPRRKGDAPDPKMVDNAKQNIMKPSSQLAAVLVSRLGAMTDEQLAELDRAITPEAAKALLMLLPELGSLMEAIAQSGQAGSAPKAPQAGPQMGALGGMS
jgi:uncharacterized protein YgbK (DUF1537 family)